ncbi:hypothetical protein BJ122_10410 [Rhodopseudomonas faecalis]|uniref:Uncharacterized protein n=1 Tax=Rhodopseudomonas faecalis TaxID=99655 RepID=A0A318THV3_9BRAD|nr:hypothetical protein [Rhodopseudomonas faecalis]PYF04033.1 hypothetical protein BJ122_10410 [Rhodopseudomonas faecalis]TAH68048.1 MAG: hypothetical protein EWM45_05050 [Rhodopseudomonas palustris]
MRDLLSFAKMPVLGAAALLGALALTPPAQAANFLEMNFWMSGPRYDGQLPSCEAGLTAINSQFTEKEQTFWNSRLEITGFTDIHETALRPWQSDNIPRRFCSGTALFNDGKARKLHYSIIEDGGFASFGHGVEFCVVGLDRDWAYNPACKAARP